MINSMPINQIRQFREWERGNDRGLAYSETKRIFREVTGKEPATDQKDKASDVRAMISSIVSELEKAVQGRYKGPDLRLKAKDSQRRMSAVYQYAEKLSEIAKEYDFSRTQKNLSQQIRFVLEGSKPAR